MLDYPTYYGFKNAEEVLGYVPDDAKKEIFYDCLQKGNGGYYYVASEDKDLFREMSALLGEGFVNDKEVAKVLIDEMWDFFDDDETAYKLIDKSLFKDKQFILDIYELDPSRAPQYIDGDLCDDKELFLELIDFANKRSDYDSSAPVETLDFVGGFDPTFEPVYILNGASEKLRNDKDFMLEVIKKIGINFDIHGPEEWIGEELKADSDFQEKLAVLLEERDKTLDEYIKYQEKKDNPADPEG